MGNMTERRHGASGRDGRVERRARDKLVRAWDNKIRFAEEARADVKRRFGTERQQDEAYYQVLGESWENDNYQMARDSASREIAREEDGDDAGMSRTANPDDGWTIGCFAAIGFAVLTAMAVSGGALDDSGYNEPVRDVAPFSPPPAEGIMPYTMPPEYDTSDPFGQSEQVPWQPPTNYPNGNGRPEGGDDIDKILDFLRESEQQPSEPGCTHQGSHIPPGGRTQEGFRCNCIPKIFGGESCSIVSGGSN